MSNRHNLETVYEPEDDRPESERELEAYHAAVASLDRDDLLAAGCARLPYEGYAVAELLALELTYPVDDDQAPIHPDLAQRVTRQVRRALRVSIDEQATVHQVVEARA